MCNHPNREEAMVRLRDRPAVFCDPCIADLVDALNPSANWRLRTVASCCGHEYRPGRISLTDGRELFIADAEQAERIEAAFPIDINGDRRCGCDDNAVCEVCRG